LSRQGTFKIVNSDVPLKIVSFNHVQADEISTPLCLSMMDMDIKVSKLDLLHPKFPKIFVLQVPEELIEEKIRLQVRLRRGVYRDTLVPMKSAG